MARGAQRARALVACAACALAFLGTADAQTNRSVSQVERERQAEARRAEELRRQAAGARAEIGALDARLVDSGRRRTEAETAATAAEARLAALRAQLATDAAAQTRARDAYERALIAAAFSRNRVEPRAARATVLARALAPEYAAAQQRSAVALDRGRRLEAAIADEQRILADAYAAIDAERAELVTLLARRRAAQTQLTADATAAERRARALAAEARNLRDLAQRVQPPRRGRTQPSGPSVIPAAWLAPAEGQVVRAYGTRHGDAPPAQGALVRTRAGAQVVAPASGEIAYAGAFRSYGQVLILNVDGGYALVLTGLGNIRAQVGDTVRAGQPIGEMSAAATPAPELYVEVRRDGQPVDPGRWLNARGVTVAANGARAG
ncbi:MAG: murein hydrolase activator EnvC [Hyphomonadaceae bacterium]